MSQRSPRRWLLLAALASWGCGNQELWARYQAEREFWHARRAVERIQVRPELARPQDFDRAIAAFQSIVDRFPAATWATPERLAHRTARDVAAISGDALLAVGRLEESRGAVSRALEIYRRAAEDFAAFPPARLKALVATAAALERDRGAAAATPVYAEIARTFPPVDPESGVPIRAALDAPLRVASELRTRGLGAVADSVLAAADRRFTAEAERLAGQAVATEVWMRVAQVRLAQREGGPVDPALGALRMALADTAAGTRRSELVLTLAEYCLQGGRPDSALAYSRWAARDFGRETRGQAMLLEGRIWESANLDSAIAAYGRYLEAFRNAGGPAQSARFRRAELFEKKGRWEQARAEYRALASSSAVDDLALQATERIVTHHLELGERDLARIEGHRAIEHLDRLLTSVQDEESLMRIRQTRSRLLLAIGSWPEAVSALSDLWSRYGQLPSGVNAGFRAAQVAEREMNNRVRAIRLYEELAARAPEPNHQAAARRELARLRGGPTSP